MKGLAWRFKFLISVSGSCSGLTKKYPTSFTLDCQSGLGRVVRWSQVSVKSVMAWLWSWRLEFESRLGEAILPKRSNRNRKFRIGVIQCGIANCWAYEAWGHSHETQLSFWDEKEANNSVQSLHQFNITFSLFWCTSKHSFFYLRRISGVVPWEVTCISMHYWAIQGEK